MRPTKGLLPNSITVVAIFLGYVSILQTFQGAYVIASLCIIVAGVLDMLDGRVARMINASSEFGVQFDSLADVINYGVAPSVLLYNAYLYEWGMLGIIISFLPTACAAIRLARYNVGADPHTPTKCFNGLPTTMAAMVMASFVIFAHHVYPNSSASFAAFTLMSMLSFLMVSDVPYDKQGMFSWRNLQKTRNLFTASLVGASLIFFPQVAFFAWGLGYVLHGLVKSTLGTVRYKMAKGQ